MIYTEMTRAGLIFEELHRNASIYLLSFQVMSIFMFDIRDFKFAIRRYIIGLDSDISDNR